ncbi:hypothetical protein OH807_07695 [Kitasatospora sp. NBC_01560]|uniref:hypothetical protein n=1 Tax=Kitasatospora sp. NBC_01560 TaxID=2975965 RepID=UPI003865945C
MNAAEAVTACSVQTVGSAAGSLGPAGHRGPGGGSVPVGGSGRVGGSRPAAGGRPDGAAWAAAAGAAGVVEACRAVEQLAAERATGVLRAPAGAVYLAGGLVVHAESDRAPGLAALLAGCGRIGADAWRETVRTYGPQGRVGTALVEQHHFTRAELELCQLVTLYDAAYFVFGAARASAGPWSFEPGARHWLGPVVGVSVRRLRGEVERRRRLLEAIWPWPQLDTAPVRPLAVQERCAAGQGGRSGRAKPPSRRQRELLDHADGRRTPVELARLLGRSAFATTADVRRLAAAGLLATPGRSAPRHAAQVPAQGRPAAGRPPAGPPPTGSSAVGLPPVGLPPTGSPVVGPPPAGPTAVGLPAPGRAGGGLHRRIPGAALAALLPSGARSTGPSPPVRPPTPVHPPTPAAAHPLTVPDPDIALLTRVRTLLEARL